MKTPNLAGSFGAPLRGALLLAAATLLLPALLKAQTVSMLHSLGASPGSYPAAPLAPGPKGDFYGVTYEGGARNRGTVFKISTSGSQEVLYSFGVNPADGPAEGLVFPNAVTRGVDGNFYGTTRTGGSNRMGMVFKVTPSGSETVLYSFGSSLSKDARLPFGPLVQGPDGNLYGTAAIGGAYGGGTVFKITTSGSETVLYSFSGADGQTPRGGLAWGTDGNLYGTTSAGGSNGMGTVYKLTTSGSETVLYSFGTSGTNDAQAPYSALVRAADGIFYGTTTLGGAQGKGTVFKVTPSGTETVLYSFGASGGDGQTPRGALAQGADGSFYGTTSAGGSQGQGTIFKVTSAGFETVLHSFWVPGGDGHAGTDGEYPVGGLVLGADGNLYGTTNYGGSHGQGTVYKVDPSGAETVLHSFGIVTGKDGGNPIADLVQAGDGLYGVTQTGGSKAGGAFFKLAQSGTESVLYSFGSNPADGIAPQSLLRANDGKFYGATYSDSTNFSGAVFQITASGSEAVLHAFGATPSDGANPVGSMLELNLGEFYGVTYYGGAQGYGTVYKVTVSGSESVLYSFGSAGVDGQNPQGGLVKGDDGNLYGTTINDNNIGGGTFFQITPQGTETVLYYFASTDPNDGYFPMGTLVSSGSGVFYGTTNSGGTYGRGTVFRITESGSESVLYNFGPGADDGVGPQAGLVLARDGNLYGTTYNGGTFNQGTVFRISGTGSESFLQSSGSCTETVLYSFGSNSGDGIYPAAALVQADDGNLYGTTLYGGANGGGALFEVELDASMLTVLVNNNAGGTVSLPPSSKRILGNSYQVTATPAHTYLFDGWGASDNSAITSPGNPLTFTMTPNLVLTASFSAITVAGTANAYTGEAVGATSGTYASFGAPQPGAFFTTQLLNKKPVPSIVLSGNVLLQTGTAMPGLPGSVIASLGQPLGDALLGKLTAGHGGITAATSSVLVTGLSSGAPVVSAQTGTATDALPNGVTFQSFKAIDGNGTATFFLATLAGTGVIKGNNTALCAATGTSLNLLARTGAMVSGSATTIAQITTLVGSAGTAADGRWRVDDTNIGVRLTYAGNNSQAIYSIPASASSSADWTLLAQTGTSAVPGINGAVIASFSLPGFGPGGCAAVASLKIDGQRVTKGNNTALLAVNNGAQAVLARKGDLVPKDANNKPLSGISISGFGDPIVGGTGNVAFLFTATGPSASAEFGQPAIAYFQSGTTYVIANQGAAAPGGGHWAKFTSLVLPKNPALGPIFTGNLRVSAADGVTSHTNAGLWAMDSTGMLDLLLWSGATLPINGQPKIVQSFLTLGVPPGSAGGVASGYDDNGNVELLLNLPSSQKALWSLPVP